MMRMIDENKRIRELKELARKLLYDEVVVYASRISWQPIYEILVKDGHLYLVYKFKGETAWDEAHDFVDELKNRNIDAVIDYDASERDKVFVMVKVPINEYLQIHKIDYDEWLDEL